MSSVRHGHRQSRRAGRVNLVGLKRRDFERDEITLRSAFGDIFVPKRDVSNMPQRARETYAESGLA